jgi:hypothetical protein
MSQSAPPGSRSPLDDSSAIHRLRYVENEQVPHNLNPRKTATHVAKVLRLVYKFRSDRGAVHISPDYVANQMDARLILENSRWLFAELLRVVWTQDREEVASATRNLLRFDVPCIGLFGDRILVQRTDLTVEEEILVILHRASERGMNRTELGKTAMAKSGSISHSLGKLCAAGTRQVIDVSGQYCLTDLGVKRVREELGGKLELNP